MDTSNTNTNIDDQRDDDDDAAPRSRPRRVSRRLVGGLAILLVGGALSLSAAQAHGFGGGPGGGFFGGGGFMAFRMHKMLDKVGATPGQRAQIKAIWEGLRPQLKTMHEQHAALRQQVTQAMTATTIDPAAVEKLRQQSVQLMDKASTVITRGFVETARVLTPEQRKQIAAELEKAAEHRRAHFEEGGAGAP
jgi:Spy/CpxP family protein refolding chaperone